MPVPGAIASFLAFGSGNARGFSQSKFVTLTRLAAFPTGLWALLAPPSCERAGTGAAVTREQASKSETAAANSARRVIEKSVTVPPDYLLDAHRASQRRSTAKSRMPTEVRIDRMVPF
jgi:hypothetical protein